MAAGIQPLGVPGGAHWNAEASFDSTALHQMTKAVDKLFSEYDCATIAHHLNVSRQRVWNWKLRSRIPAVHCIKIEQMTAGKYTRYKLNEETFGKA